LATENRELAKAMSLVKDALKVSPNSPAYLDSLGWIYFRMGLVDDAYAMLKRAKDILQDNDDINFHFSEIMKAMARNREEDKISKNKEFR
jgi:tetratricopeptide (TPR) repeat protein